jgi:hypothetical protein
MKVRFIAALAVSVCIMALSPAFAEEAETISTKQVFDNALGVYATTIGFSEATGGLQYQHWFDNVGFQITAGGSYNPQSYWRSLNYTVLLDGLFSVYHDNITRWLSGNLYVWATVGHHGYISAYDVYGTTTGQTFVPNFVAGAGIGIETVLFRHFSIPIQFGYTAEFPVAPTAGFSVGTGIRYRF